MDINEYRQNIKPKLIKKRTYEEHDTQVAFVKWFCLQWPQYSEIIYAIPNGEERNPIVAKRLKDEGVQPGIPDVCIPVPSGDYNSLYIEFKAKGKTASDVQKRKIKQLQELGHCVHVCDSLDRAMDAVKLYFLL